MKTALEASAKHLTEMKEYAEDCMKHMTSMEMMDTAMPAKTK